MRRISVRATCALAFACALFIGPDAAQAVTANINVAGTPPGVQSITLQIVEEGQTTPITTVTTPPGQAAQVTIPDDKRDKRLCVRYRDDQGNQRDLPCFVWRGGDLNVNFGGNQVTQARGGGGTSAGIGIPRMWLNLFVGGNFGGADGSSISNVAPTSLTGSGDLDNFKFGAEVMVFAPFAPIRLGGDGGPRFSFFGVAGGDIDPGNPETLIMGTRHPGQGNDQLIEVDRRGTAHAGLGVRVRTGMWNQCDGFMSSLSCFDFGVWAGANASFYRTRTQNNESGGGGLNNISEQTDTTWGPSGGVFVGVRGPRVFGLRSRLFGAVDVHGQGDINAGDFSTAVGTYNNTVAADTVVNARFGITFPFGGPCKNMCE